MSAKIRVDGRGMSRSNEDIYGSCGMLEGAKGAAPAGASTPYEGLTEPEWGSAMQESTEDRRRIAGEYLTRARDDFERAVRTRIVYALNARRYGMTYDAIGALLGITEGAVRSMVKRHGGGA